VPALRGSLTYARFFVEGEVPDDFRERFMKAVRLRVMKPLEPDEEELERSGWVKIGEPFVVDVAYEDVFFNEYINLGFRTDRWAIPGPTLRKRVKEAEAAYLEKKGRERLSKKEKSELKLMVMKKLRRQMEPATRSVDLSWSINEGIVRFFTHAQKPAGTMMELFKKTFGLTLIPESPYTAAARIGLDKEQEKAWNELEMTYLGSGERLVDEAAEEEE
jgi:recombination associated protein RdgC